MRVGTPAVLYDTNGGPDTYKVIVNNASGAIVRSYVEQTAVLWNDTQRRCFCGGRVDLFGCAIRHTD